MVSTLPKTLFAIARLPETEQFFTLLKYLPSRENRS